MRTNLESVSDSMDVHVIYRVTCNLGQKEANSKWSDVVMTVCNGVYVTQHEVLIIKNQQDRQRTYNVTLRRLRATIVAVEEQYVLHIPSVYL
jgi:hypothetical protein